MNKYKSKYTGAQIDERLTKVDTIPTKVSQLTNDSSYATTSAVSAGDSATLTSAKTYTDTKVGTLSELTTTDKSNVVKAVNEVNANLAKVNTDLGNRVLLLEEAAKGDLYTTSTDSTKTVRKQIPNKALSVFYMPNLGGCCTKYNQLISVISASNSVDGVTFTNNNDGTVTVNGTATQNKFWAFNSSAFENTIIGHKYLLRGSANGGSNLTYGIRYNTNGFNETGNGVIVTRATSGDSAYLTFNPAIFVANGTTCNNLVFKPQLVDLTEIYGSGREPNTVDAFLSDYPIFNNVVPYTKGTIAKNYATSVDIVGKNIFNPSNIVKGRLDNGVVGYADGTTSMTTNGSGVDYTTNVSYRGVVTDYIKVDSSSTYYLRFTRNKTDIIPTASLYDDSKNFISSASYSNVQNTNDSIIRFSTSTASYIRIQFQASTSGSASITNVVFFKSDSTIEYVPFKNTTLLSSEIVNSIKSAVGGEENMALGYIDFAKKRFVKNMGKVDLGTLDWTNENDIKTGQFRTYAKLFTTGVTNDNAVCSNYTFVGFKGYNSFDNGEIGYSNTWAWENAFLRIVDERYTTKSAFQSALKGVILYYELATPIETDLRTILQDVEINDFGMVVRGAEALGSVVFNTNNDLPVPSTETYLIKSV